MQGISVRLAVTLICIVAGASIGGGILGYYLARKEQKIRQLAHRLSKEGRAERKRRDTENNIGNRFWKLAEKYILENSVLWERNVSTGQGYDIVIWRRKSSGRFFSVYVNLGCDENGQLRYTLGDSSCVDTSIDEVSIQAALGKVDVYLNSYYSGKKI